MTEVRKPAAVRLNFIRGWMVYLPFLMLVMVNYVDQYFVTFQGGAATKAYTLGMAVFWILMAIGTVISAVMSSMIKQKLDAGDAEGADKTASNALFYTVIFSIVDSFIVAFGLVPVFLTLPEPDVSQALREFLRPLFILNFAMASNLVLMGMLAALGQRTLYLLSILITIVCEMCFTPFFIFDCGLGMFGNGLGTAVSLSFTGAMALLWILDGKTSIRLSWGLVDWHPRDIWRAFLRIKEYIVKNVAQHVGELAIRLQLYLTYTLTYGIPMLYSSLVVIFGSGTAASTAARYRRYYAVGDADGAYRLFRDSLVETFFLMAMVSAIMIGFDAMLMGIFINHADLEESRQVAEWTMDILLISAPFLGLRIVCRAVFIDRPQPRKEMIVAVAFTAVRTVVLVFALWMDYPLLIYLILGERMLVGAFSVLSARRYILSKKGHEDVRVRDPD